MNNFRLRALLALFLVGGFLLFNLFKNESARSGGEEIVLETRPIDPRDIFFGHYAILSYDIEAMTPERSFQLMDEELIAKLRSQSERGNEAETGNANSAWGETLYVAMEKKGSFHVPATIALTYEEAAGGGAPVLKARGGVHNNYRECRTENDVAGIDCAWRIWFSFNLPDRYYADKATALALEDKQRVAARAAADRRRFEECERERTENVNGALSDQCDGVGEPTPAEKFGVILSVDDQGSAVIKGVLIGEARYYDSLTGARLTKEAISE